MDIQKLRIEASADGIQLGVAFVEPETESMGIVQLVHGMCEHKERYYGFMEFLAANGYVCVIHDHRGHGESVKDPADLGYMYGGGWRAMVEDIEKVRIWSAEKWPHLTRTLLGHSMGSMAVRSYVKRYGDRIDRLIVCGSPSSNQAAWAGRLLSGTIGLVRGDHHRPQIMQDIAFGSFNKPFEGEGYASAWVCSDRKTLEEYHHDPLCQFIFTANGFRNLMGLMMDCYSRKGWTVADPDMPVLFISGADDPCRIGDRQHRNSIDLMRKVGYRHVDSILYPGMRHEILNETGRQEVWDRVLSYIGPAGK